MTVWSISVKTVGGSQSIEAATNKNHNQTNGTNLSTSNGGANSSRRDVSSQIKNSEKTAGTSGSSTNATKKSLYHEGGIPDNGNFTVEVEAEDHLSSLHDRIEEVTGLRSSQQRLIYRGRLLLGSSNEHQNSSSSSATSSKPSTTNTNNPSSSSASPSACTTRIRDVDGLCDGQTIHLVPRRAPTEDDTPSTATATASPSHISSGSSVGNASSATNLLATLLGLTLPPPSGEQEGAGRIVRPLRTRGRPPTTPRTRDPQSLEPVRQGLLTLHTMLQHVGANANQNTDRATATAPDLAVTTAQPNPQAMPEDARPQPMQSYNSTSDIPTYPRRWYVGQWLDVKDTVDQWLEATVVEIVTSRDLSGSTPSTSSSSSASSHNNRNGKRPRDDPIVGSNDLEGRNRLFHGEDDEAQGVHLLLVHYNGWPHRWDEWIRSDSDRIRPFRTRTTHSMSCPYASPTPNSLFAEAPNTFFERNDDNDRALLAPELHHIMSTVQALLTQAIPVQHSRCDVDDSTATQTPHLPWQSRHELDESVRTNGFNRDQLLLLAPLLDRLGRTLTDAAPHLANFANTLPVSQTTVQNEDKSNEDDDVKMPPHNDDTNNSQNEDRVSSVNMSTTAANRSSATRNGNSDNDNNVDSEMLDYSHAFVNTSMRDDSHPTRRTRSSQTTTSSTFNQESSIFGTFLGPSSNINTTNNNNTINTFDDRSIPSTLTRLLRVGNAEGGSNANIVVGGSSGGNGGGSGSANSNGGGIDIHIHAIVTPVGMDVPFGGLADDLPRVIPPAIASAVNSSLAEALDTTLPSYSTDDDEEVDDDDEEFALFSDLYTENPTPFRFSRTENHGEGGNDGGGSKKGTDKEENSERKDASEAVPVGMRNRETSSNNNDPDSHHHLNITDGIRDAVAGVVAYSMGVGDIPSSSSAAVTSSSSTPRESAYSVTDRSTATAPAVLQDREGDQDNQSRRSFRRLVMKAIRRRTNFRS